MSYCPLRQAVAGACAALLALALGAIPAVAQEATASLWGRVTEPVRGPVAGAAVWLGADGRPAREARTDSAGAYRFTGLAPGRYRMRVEHEGYARVERGIRLAAGEAQRADVRLVADTVILEGVVVEGRGGADRERARFESEPGVTARVIGGDQLKMLPGLAEADVMRAVEVLPGVVSTSDFSSSFNVRGGSADQNLILLDGFPIFNPFHLGGLFSVFNSDAVARAELLAGGFGAEYGGRVSSVLNVETRTSEPGAGLHVDAGLSVLASRVLLRAPLPSIGGRQGSWLLSARRSYFDQLLRPVVDFPYHLTDLQGHAELGLRGGGRVSVTGYGGGDVLDLSNFQPPGDDSTSILRVRWNWGNRLLGVRWQQPVGAAWVADSRFGVSSFSDALSFPDFGHIRFASGISQLSLQSDWGRNLSESLGLKVGGAVQRMRFRNLAEAGGTTFFESAGAGVLSSLYASVQAEPDSRWIVQPGLRADLWAAGGDPRAVVSPRLAVKRFVGEERDAALKLAVGRYAQFLHSLRNEELPISNDTWVLAGENVPPVVSDQVQLGVERYWGERWSASAETYYRVFRGVTELNLADDPNDPADDLVSGTGRSMGLDLLVRRSAGRLTGWTTVSLLRATRTLPDPLAAGWEELSPTVTFAPVFDRRVDVDLVVQYRFPWQVELGGRWNYGSSLPYTRPVAQHFAWSYAPLRDRFEPRDPFGDDAPVFVVLGQRNAERYPDYHRLDVTLRRTFRPRWGSWTPYLQVLNVYNRKNVLWYFYNYDRLPPTRSGISMFPVLPAIGVEASF